MDHRVPASERTSKKIRDLLEEGLAAGADSDVKSRFLELAVQKVMEELLEAVITTRIRPTTASS